MDRNGKVALVCGASGGLGPVVAETLATHGFRTFGTMRDPARATGTYNFPMIAMDALDDASVDACMAEILERSGRLDVAVNCINEMMLGAVDEMSMADFQLIYDVNVIGAIRMNRAAYRIMRGQGSGVIINLSSLGGVLPVPLLSAYTSSKFALEAFSEALYQEAKSHGVHVVIMQPVAMQMDRSDVGAHLKVAAGAGEGSLTHRMVRRMGKDTRESKLTPQMVADKIAKVALSNKRKLRYPMDRAKVVGAVRRFGPQLMIDRIMAPIVAPRR